MVMFQKKAMMIYMYFVVVLMAQEFSTHATDITAKGFVFSDYTQEEYNRDFKHVETCRSGMMPVEQIAPTVLCYYDYITQENVETFITLLDGSNVKTLILGSMGGDVNSAFKMGLAINQKGLKVILDGPCLSSCANYLVPAASRLVVLPWAFIGMHGSPQRGKAGYIDNFLEKRRSDEAMIDFQKRLKEMEEAYPEYFTNVIVPETQFFMATETSERYLTRYSEVKSNINTYAKNHCKPKHGLFLIVGPEYYKAFLGRKDAMRLFWWPKDKEEMIKTVRTHFPERWSIILDNDLFPSWVSGRGQVTQTECFNEAR